MALLARLATTIIVAIIVAIIVDDQSFPSCPANSQLRSKQKVQTSQQRYRSLLGAKEDNGIVKPKFGCSKGTVASSTDISNGSE